MLEEDSSDDSFEDTVRSIARELGRSLEHAAEQVDFDEIAETIGVDPARAREWVESASGWLRAQAESLGEEVAQRMGRSRATAASEDALRGVAPHPLDVPTEDQGLALAALDSGRWTIEPGANALASHGDGPGPTDALGIVRELRVRDWLGAEDHLTLAGRYALSRWLDAANRR
jgi:hypothetical protein